jgi:hypothetical protein
MTPGVASGLVITPTTGRQVSVSAGAAIVADGAGGCYVAYIDTATTLTIAATSTQNIYIVVDDPGTGATTVTAGTAPTDPYLTIGTATANASLVTTTAQQMNVRSIAVPPAMAGAGPAAPVYNSGGTMTGNLTVPTLTSTGLITANQGLYSPIGVRLGSGGSTARHMGSAGSTSGAATSGVWDRVVWTTTGYSISDYGVTARPAGTVRFHAGVTGDYAIGGHVTLEGNVTGTRHIRVCVYKNGDTAGASPIRAQYGQEIGTESTNPPTMMIPGFIRMASDEYFAVEVYQNSGTALTYSSGFCQFRLIQAG